jgi:RNA polymerase sigma-70 factor (ECF subfamily)
VPQGFLPVRGPCGAAAAGHQADGPRLHIKKLLTLRAVEKSADARQRCAGRAGSDVMDTACALKSSSGAGAVAAASAGQRLDKTLLESIAAGDRFAMQVLFQRHNVRVYRFVSRLTGNPALAEEVVSEVFLNVWRRAATFDAKCQVSTWLLAIARHKAVSVLRRRLETDLDEEVAATIADPCDDAETMLHRQDRSRIIRRCLAQLSPSHREIIDLVYYHEKSVDEVARIVDAPKSTVKTRMFYARNHMAKLLSAAGVNAP